MKTTKRILACILSALLLLAAVPANPVYAADGGAYATTGDVFMREKASKNSEAIATLSKGTTVTVTDTSDKTWFKATYKNKKGKSFTGYVSAKWLKKLAETYLTTGEVNLRREATTKSDILAVVPAKSAVSVTDTSNETWFKVTYKNKKGKSFAGYMSSKYLEKKTDQKQQKDKKDTKKKDSKKAATAKSVYVATGSVNLRAKASTDSDILTTLSKGDAVTVTDTSNKTWFKATYKNKKGKSFTGYISSKYLQKKADSKQKKDTGKDSKTDSKKKGSKKADTAKTYVTTGNVYLRAKASKDSDAVATLSKGAAVTVTDTSNKSWFKVVYMDKNSNSYTGYISSKYLQKK